MGHVIVPMDDLGRTGHVSDSEDWELRRIRNWYMHFCLWPRMCFLTKRYIWLTECYKGTNIITGPGSPICNDYYIDRHEFIIWKLKQ